MDRETKDSAFCSASVNYAAGRFCILITIPFREEGYRLEEAGISLSRRHYANFEGYTPYPAQRYIG